MILKIQSFMEEDFSKFIELSGDPLDELISVIFINQALDILVIMTNIDKIE